MIRDFYQLHWQVKQNERVNDCWMTAGWISNLKNKRGALRLEWLILANLATNKIIISERVHDLNANKTPN